MRQRVKRHNFARFPLQIDEQIDPQPDQTIPAGIRTTITHESRGFALPLNFCRQNYRMGHGRMWISAEQTHVGRFGRFIEEFLSVNSKNRGYFGHPLQYLGICRGEALDLGGNRLVEDVNRGFEDILGGKTPSNFTFCCKIASNSGIWVSRSFIHWSSESNSPAMARCST